MKTNIGNSQKAAFSSTVLLQQNSNSKCFVEVDEESIFIETNPRQDWTEAAKQMHTEKDDELLSEDLPNNFEQEEWTW